MESLPSESSVDSHSSHSSVIEESLPGTEKSLQSYRDAEGLNLNDFFGAAEQLQYPLAGLPDSLVTVESPATAESPVNLRIPRNR